MPTGNAKNDISHFNIVSSLVTAFTATVMSLATAASNVAVGGVDYHLFALENNFFVN